LNKDVPLGPNLNGAIVVWPELIYSVGIYPNFSNLWKHFLLHPNLNEVVPICSNFIKIVKIYPNDFYFIQI